MDTSSHCVKAEGRCSEVRCNICPRYTYDRNGPTYRHATAQSKPRHDETLCAIGLTLCILAVCIAIINWLAK